MLTSLPNVRKRYRLKSLKIDVFDTPSPENPCEYPHTPYIAIN